MPIIEINIPTPKDMQVLYKSKVVGTEEYLKKIEEVLLSNEHIGYDFVKNEETGCIDVYLKATKNSFFIFKKNLQNKVGYVQEDITVFLYENNLLNDIVFSPYSIDIKENYHEIHIYFNVLIKKNKFKTLKKEGLIDNKYSIKKIK